MLDLQEVPGMITTINEILQQNSQDVLNYDTGLLHKQNSNYFFAKMEAFQNVATLAVRALEDLLDVNDKKNSVQVGNQGLRQDLCAMCMINSDLQDLIFEKDKEIELILKQLKATQRKLSNLEKELLVAADNNYRENQNLAHFRLSESQGSNIMPLPDIFNGIAMIQSKIQPYTEDFHYEQILTLRSEIVDLKMTINRLTSVVQLMEQRQSLRKKEQQIKLFELQQKQQGWQEEYEVRQIWIQKNKKQEEQENMQTLAFSRSSLSNDIKDLENSDESSQKSIMGRIKKMRGESSPELLNPDLKSQFCLRENTIQIEEKLKKNQISEMSKQNILNPQQKDQSSSPIPLKPINQTQNSQTKFEFLQIQVHKILLSCHSLLRSQIVSKRIHKSSKRFMQM